MSVKPKILLITNLFPTPTAPTRGIFVYEMVRMLRSRCDVTVMCPLPYFPKWEFLRFLPNWHALAKVPRRYDFNGITVHSPKYFLLPKVSESIHAFLMFAGIFSAVKELNRSGKIDLINAQWMYPDGVAAAWVARRIQKPIVIGGHGSDVNIEFQQASKRKKMLAAFGIARSITVVSKAMKRKLLQAGVPEGKIDVVSNGFDPAVFHPQSKAAARSQLGLPKEGKIILFVGRVVPEKGVHELLSAFGRLNNAGTSLVFVGPTVNGFHKQSVAGVTFVGSRPHKEVADWMAAADVFCLPSYSEGCPTVVLEALGSGRPVVASNVGGIPDIVGKDNGILVAPENVGALANALKAALDRTWDAEKIAAGIAHLTWEKVADKYADIFIGKE